MEALVLCFLEPGYDREKEEGGIGVTAKGLGPSAWRRRRVASEQRAATIGVGSEQRSVSGAVGSDAHRGSKRGLTSGPGHDGRRRQIDGAHRKWNYRL
jgi:hypothetical protein